MSNSNIPPHHHTMDMSKLNPEDSYWYQLREGFSRDINAQHNYKIPTFINGENDPYALLFAELHALEQELAVLREELADLRVRVKEAEMRGSD